MHPHTHNKKKKEKRKTQSLGTSSFLLLGQIEKVPFLLSVKLAGEVAKRPQGAGKGRTRPWE